MTFGILLFPYLEEFITKYDEEIALFFLFSSFIVSIVIFLFFLLIQSFKRWLPVDKEGENHLFIYLYYIIRLALLTTLVAYVWTIIDKYWILLSLIAIEVYGLWSNNEFHRNQKAES